MTPHEKYTIKLSLIHLEQADDPNAEIAVKMLTELLKNSLDERPAIYSSSRGLSKIGNEDIKQ